jgi:tripartite-type tricarboxylate transporter receptor subunit TctC
VSRLNELIVAATLSAPARSYYESSGVEAWSTTSDELGKFQAADTVKWGKVVKAAGIEPE